MPLQHFTFDKKPDIRLVVYGHTVYKIKVTCRQSSNRESIRKLCKEEKNHKDLERVVCAILNSDVLVPVQTDCFVVYPYKTHWETSDKVLFSQHGKALDAHPYAFTMYVEERQTVPKHLNHSEQTDEPTESGVTAGGERIVTGYGQKNRHEVEEKDLKEFLRLQQMASEEDEDTDDSEQCEEHPSGLQRVFNALVSPVRSFLGH
ncbi:PREDICTED: membrane-anchored junction protein-like isoform X1 [Acropora digitifera]|uniref:membrane-anchored junction protein-like isoform X1 n=1 Tax=Acropora digitifera TaxID=70779 RepID=UPI00077ABF51|nr:PREDICTED: membrane-anchored junction protein-like isoform X1 [Acropora digitifera]